MDPRETDLLEFENDLLNARKQLNELIYKYADQNHDLQNYAIRQDKINYFETELKYLNNQLQILKNSPYHTPLSSGQPIRQSAGISPNIQEPSSQAVAQQTVQSTAPAAPQRAIQSTAPAALQQTKFTMYATSADTAQQSKSRDYEKLFGRNFMGIFASVLIFISLIIFATLMLPYLTDTIKLIGLYVISFSILAAGYIPARKNRTNKFFIALIGCGIGSLYISLLLSDLYFKVIGDMTLYILILVWAVLVKYLPGLKNMVFHIIGQSGILIATILGTALCVHDADAAKYFVLTVFYFISAIVFAGRDRTNYVQNLCNHICTAMNLIIFAVGLALMKPTGLRVINILAIILYMLAEFYFAYREEYRDGIAFQLLTIVNSITFIWLFHLTELLAKDATYLFMYIAAIALLFYVYKKHAAYEIISEIFFLAVIYLGCHNHPFIRNHLYAYLTVIPAMIYGKIKDKKLYLYAALAFTVELLIPNLSDTNGYGVYMITNFSANRYVEYLIMTAVVYLSFLYICHTTNLTSFKMIGYILINLVLVILVHDSAYRFMKDFNTEHIRTIEDIAIKANLIPFFILALIHLVLTRLSYFGTSKPVEYMLLVINALLMIAGCIGIGCRPWKPATIMITALLFLINSRRLLLRDQRTGYYIAFKYTVFMVCVLNSYDVVNYVISISLLLFAILSIIIGFYRNNITFRLYGLILSMISIVKLIMVDIQYDSTIENAVSFFVSGVLCFAISFIYHKIDT
ncbi:MAG: DUF2339 domain-containing protein, partial [Lachnospiraceae bacterium]|nr:DUF2339 domain-containing protein [Lachnospiraceae bacterium]